MFLVNSQQWNYCYLSRIWKHQILFLQNILYLEMILSFFHARNYEIWKSSTKICHVCFDEHVMQFLKFSLCLWTAQKRSTGIRSRVTLSCTHYNKCEKRWRKNRFLTVSIGLLVRSSFLLYGSVVPYSQFRSLIISRALPPASMYCSKNELSIIALLCPSWIVCK